MEVIGILERAIEKELEEYCENTLNKVLKKIIRIEKYYKELAITTAVITIKDSKISIKVKVKIVEG